MKKLFIKIKYLFIPYILLGVGTILFLAGFRWIFNFHWNLLNLKIEIWELWIPICLPFFSVLFILRNRIKIIKQSKDERRHFFYQMIMVIAITVPNFLFQAYWSKALFDLQTVNSITEIENFPKEKYFKINNFNVDREKFAIHTVMETSGRYNRQLNLEFYASAPFGELKSNYWYGKKYSELSENEGEEQNQQAYKLFFEHSCNKYRHLRFQKVKYFERLVPSNDLDAFLKGIIFKYPEKATTNQIVLVSKKDEFDNRTDNKLIWTFVAFGIGLTIVFISLLFPGIDRIAYNKIKRRR